MDVLLAFKQSSTESVSPETALTPTILAEASHVQRFFVLFQHFKSS